MSMSSPHNLGGSSLSTRRQQTILQKCLSNALGYAILLRHVGGRKLLDDAGSQAILFERVARVFPSFVGTPANDSATAKDDSMTVDVTNRQKESKAQLLFSSK